MFLVLLVLATMTIILSKENFLHDYHYYEIVFDEAIGLSDGDQVYIRGVEAGTIKAVWLQVDGVHVTLSMDEVLTLYEDYVIEIRPGSLLGGRYIQVYEGSYDQQEVATDQVLQGARPIDFMAEIGQAAEELRKIAEGIREGRGTLGKLVSDDTMYEDLEAITANIREVSDRLANGKGTIGKLLQEDDELYRNLTEASASIRALTASLENGEGMIGKLMTDDELYYEIKALVEELRAGIDDMRETSPIATFSSIFFGAF